MTQNVSESRRAGRPTTHCSRFIDIVLTPQRLVKIIFYSVKRSFNVTAFVGANDYECDFGPVASIQVF